MSTKLTLTINKSVIEEAKKYAKSQGRSLSNIIEEYLKSLVNNDKKDDTEEISPIVDSLWGSVNPIPEGTDYKEILKEELIKKYVK